MGIQKLMFQYGQNMTRTSQRNTAAVYTGDLRGDRPLRVDLDPCEVGMTAPQR
jgi:hypothetical protein